MSDQNAPDAAALPVPVKSQLFTLREAPICRASVEKLRTEGWKVSCEIPVGWGGRNCDAAASKDGIVLILEAKVSFTKGLRYQLNSAESGADFIIAAVTIKPRAEAIEWARGRGYGVWLWNGLEIIELAAPVRNFRIFEPYRQKILHRIDVFNDGVAGGKPNMKGVGPAQDCQRAVDEYRARFPKATWREIFENVPSHYDTAKNMYSALRSNAERMAIRARIKAFKIANREEGAR